MKWAIAILCGIAIVVWVGAKADSGWFKPAKPYTKPEPYTEYNTKYTLDCEHNTICYQGNGYHAFSCIELSEPIEECKKR